MVSSPLGPRLEAVARLVSCGAILADVGTDHGYLPIYLIECGKIEKAVLSDINKGPLEKARTNVKLHNLEERVELCLTDGAADLASKGITEYSVCGMGGELIADIIAAAPQMKEQGIGLILQPMSRAEALRSYLWDNGFSILKEVHSCEDGKYYVCMRAEYIGEKTQYTTPEAHFGKADKAHGDSAAQGYLRTKLSALRKAKEGRLMGGVPTDEEDELIAYAESLLKL